MTEENIYKAIIEILLKITLIKEEDISQELHYIDDLGMDSLSLVELFLECEDRFKIIIPDDQMKNIRTIRETVIFINEKTEKPTE
jgi:acyl carrier protein